MKNQLASITYAPIHEVHWKSAVAVAGKFTRGLSLFMKRAQWNEKFWMYWKVGPNRKENDCWLIEAPNGSDSCLLRHYCQYVLFTPGNSPNSNRRSRRHTHVVHRRDQMSLSVRNNNRQRIYCVWSIHTGWLLLAFPLPVETTPIHGNSHVLYIRH